MNNSSRGLAAIALAAPILTASRGGDYAGVHGHRAAGAQLVASFDPAQGQNPENLVVARDGTVHATWLFAHSVVAVRPDDSQAVVSFPAGGAAGVAIDPRRPGRLTVALISHDPGSAGIWTVLFGAFGGRLRRTTSCTSPAPHTPPGQPGWHLSIPSVLAGGILAAAALLGLAVLWPRLALRTRLTSPFGRGE